MESLGTSPGALPSGGVWFSSWYVISIGTGHGAQSPQSGPRWSLFCLLLQSQHAGTHGSLSLGLPLVAAENAHSPLPAHVLSPRPVSPTLSSWCLSSSDGLDTLAGASVLLPQNIHPALPGGGGLLMNFYPLRFPCVPIISFLGAPALNPMTLEAPGDILPPIHTLL